MLNSPPLTVAAVSRATFPSPPPTVAWCPAPTLSCPPVTVERVPVTDDKAIEVKVLDARPPGDVYDQADRDQPIRGGRRFDVTVEPGKKTPIEVVYKLVFASKLDIVGGSRRA